MVLGFFFHGYFFYYYTGMAKWPDTRDFFLHFSCGVGSMKMEGNKATQ